MLSQSEVFKILKAVREGKARRVEDVYALVAVENRDLDVMFSFFISYYQRKATSQPVTGITLDVYHFLVYLVQFSNYIGNKLAEEHFFALKEIGKQNEHDGRLICELEKVEVKSKVEKEEVACECQEEKKGLTSKEEKNLRKALEKRSERITLLEKELGRVREEKKALQTEVKDLGKKVRELELKMSKQEMDFQQRQDKMQDLQILEEKLSGLQEEIKRIEAEKAHLLSDKATLEAVLQKLKKRKQKEVAKSEQIEALQREIKSLKVQKVEGDYTQEIEDLRIELLKLKGKERARREDEQNRLEEQERIKQVILSDALQKTTLETVADHLRLDTLETRRYLNVLNRDYMILPMRSLSNNPTVQFYCPQIVPQTFDIATEDEFLETCRFVEKVGFSDIHVFPYSPRVGTVAYRTMTDVDGETKNRRAHELGKIKESLKNKFLNQQMGKTKDVLAERCRNGLWEGYSSDYTRVYFKGNVSEGQIVNVVATEIFKDGVKGEIV